MESSYETLNKFFFFFFKKIVFLNLSLHPPRTESYTPYGVPTFYKLKTSGIVYHF